MLGGRPWGDRMTSADDPSEGPEKQLERQRRQIAELTARVEAARANEELLRSVLDGVPDFVLKVDVDGRIVFINRVVAGLALDSEQVAGTTIYEYVPPESHDLVRQSIERAAKTRKPAYYETNSVGPYGSTHRYFTRVSPLIHDDEIAGFVLIATDVTQIAEVEHALHESGEKLAIVVEATRIGLWSWQIRDDTVSWDAQTCRIFGRDGPPSSAEEFFALVHPHDLPVVREHLRTTLATGVLQDVEFRIIRPDGQIRWVLEKGRVVRDEHGEIVKILGGTIDVTERHELREQLFQAQKMEAVGQLAAGIAHNFNNMLTVMLSSMELAARKAPGEAGLLLVDGQQAALRAAKMVRQLMLFAGKSRRLEPRVEDVRTIVKRTVEMCATTFPQEIQLEMSVASELPPAQCDASQLEQALLNVLINARDAVEDQDGRPREIKVTVGAIATSPPECDRPTIRISIADTGPGMSEEVRRRAFEPFFTTKEPGRGTGLGLATTYAIVKEHGGAIDIESIASVGTRVHINLPAIDSMGTAAPEAPLTPSTLGAGERILIIDDEPMVRETVARILRDASYRVETAADGATGIELVRNEPGAFAVVLLDQSMPGMSGRATLRELKAASSKLRVTCFSGYPAQLEGCEAVLEKPVPEDLLLLTIRGVIDRPARD